MALNFPDSPTLNQVHTDTTSGFSYQWDGTVWQSYSAAASKNISIVDDISGSFDGVTATFALTVSSTSLTPANAQQLRVVLGGIVQEPLTDYTVSGSNINFTTPPSGGLDCSIVSLGPAIPLSTIIDGTVTPAKLSTGGPSWNTGGDLSASGIVTAASFYGGSAVITGNVSIAGTLTYEDVTNVDSVGVITARNGVQVTGGTVDVGSGVTISSSGIDVTGVTTISNSSGRVTIGIGTTALLVEGNARITGILTVGSSSITFDGVNNTITVGTGVTISASTGLTGSGANLTSLNASNLASGTVPDARFPATLPSSSGANLTSLNASNLGSGTVPDARFPATLPSASGANLTSLNASNLGSGTVPTARLATGTANNTTYLRGDQTWASISSGITISDDTSTNATRYLTFTSATSGTISAENVSSSKLTYNPSTGAVKASSFESFVNANSILGQYAEGGYLICKSGGVGWIVSPYGAEVRRTWYCRNDAVTRAQQVSGCTGWFVPTQSQMANPGSECRNFWDNVSYYSQRYWTSTESTSINGVFVYIYAYTYSAGGRSKGSYSNVRAFRCVTY
jgi:hypothetical protein